MRAPLDWLAELVDLPPAAELSERFDLGGFEDSHVEQLGPDLSAIRVGSVVERLPHPNADRLSLCRVDVGDGEIRDVVCGAPNVAGGQKVAVALPGVLLDGKKLKRAKIRGVESNGMICSASELGLGDDHSGILVLPEDAPVGAALPEVAPTGRRILDVGITPNRGDAASLLGLAREVRAFFGGTLRLPETQPVEAGRAASESIAVSIEAPEGCHHYVARVVRGVRVGPSPEWMRSRLEDCGIRAINNLVDVTNYVLLELGQPLHAFDLATLRGAEIRVRVAREGEHLVSLDGRDLALDPRDLVIADAERPVALAGVMGGRETEVGEGSTDVLIESAHFHPTPVRLSARRHGLRSEASYRFERGVDREGVSRAADRAARLMAEIAGGEVAKGRVEARGDAPPVTESIALDVRRANRLLGTELPREAMQSLLARVDVASEPEGETGLRCRIPSQRNDLHVHQDLTEEVARIHGYDRIPTTMPSVTLGDYHEPPTRELAEAARDALAATGLVETLSLPFVGEEDLAALRLPDDDRRRRALRLANPMREEEPLLRTSIVPSLLRLARQNRARQVDRIRAFEVSRVMWPGGAGELPEEPLQVAAIITRGEDRRLWEVQRPPLFFEAKGVAEKLLIALGYRLGLRRSDRVPYLHPAATLAIEGGEQVIGAVGELHPEVAARFDLDVACALVEIDLGALAGLSRFVPRYHEVSRQPAVRRDVAVVLDASQPADTVLRAIREAAGPDCVSVELFDRYRGKGVPAGRVSLAFRLVFQRPDRTLADAEVARAVDRVIRMLTKRFGGELR